MINSIKTFSLSMCFMFSFATNSENLVSGNWSGSVTMPEKQQRPSAFKVNNTSEGSYQIMMLYNDRPYSFENLITNDDELTFTLDTGTVYSCILAWKEEGKLSGECQSKQSDESTRTISLEMLPPEPENSDDGDLEVNPSEVMSP
jgi:hypothetical protein